MIAPVSDPYAPMRCRAALFGGQARWRYVVLALLVMWFGAQLAFEAALAFIRFVLARGAGLETEHTLIGEYFRGSTPLGTQLQLATFVVFLVLLAGHMWVAHKTGLWRLAGALPLTAQQFGRVSLNLAPVYGLFLWWGLLDPATITQMEARVWLASLTLTLPLLFVQVSAEEFVFRGYLQSQIAALAHHPVIWIGAPSVLFGLIHYDPASPPYTAWAYVLWAICLGFVTADLTARSGTLGPALALHFVNNIFAVTLLATNDRLYGAALFIWPTDGEPWEPWLPFEALTLLIIWLTARLAIKR